MAHILFVTLHYPPEIGAAQTRIFETAVRLQKRGHRVTVLTTLPNHPSGVAQEEYRGAARRREMLDGVTVNRVPSYITPRRDFAHRMLSQISFGCLSPLLGWNAVGRPDIIIGVSPMLGTIGACLLAWGKRCPYIVNIADLWPEVAIQLGALRNHLAIQLAEWLEKVIYRHAAAIWCATDGIRDIIIRKGVAPDRVFALHAGCDTALLSPRPQAQARAEIGWDDAFTVLHAGTITLAHGLELMLDAAERLRDHDDIHFVVLGDSATSAKADLEKAARRRGLKHVTFAGTQPHARMPALIAASDVCLVSTRKLPLFEGALPVKMFEAMACGRPILLAVDGEAHRLVAEAGAGIYVEPGDASALAEAILRLRSDPALCEQLGRRGRMFAEAHFDRNQLTMVLESRIAGVLAGRDTRRTMNRKPAAHNGVAREPSSRPVASG